MSKELRFLEKMIQGRIGKRFVIKHYKTYKVKTKVPDMSGIIPSPGQKRQRRLFRLAVQYAQEIYWNPTKRAEKERIYRRPWRLFQKLMKEWFKKRQAKREAAQRRLNRWWRNVATNGTMPIEAIKMNTTILFIDSCLNTAIQHQNNMEAKCTILSSILHYRGGTFNTFGYYEFNCSLKRPLLFKV